MRRMLQAMSIGQTITLQATNREYISVFRDSKRRYIVDGVNGSISRALNVVRTRYHQTVNKMCVVFANGKMISIWDSFTAAIAKANVYDGVMVRGASGIEYFVGQSRKYPGKLSVVFEDRDKEFIISRNVLQ